MKKWLANSYLGLLLVKLYAPIFLVILFSFTEAKVLGNWTGFSLKLYQSLFTGGMHHALTSALWNTFLIGLVAAAISTLLGTIAAIGIYNMRPRGRRVFQTINTNPILNPDIITAISLFLLFVSLGVSQGYTTVILAHITFCTPYVVLSVLPCLRQMNDNLYDAALDLGATPFYALRKIMLPELRPGMITVGLSWLLPFRLMISWSLFLISETKVWKHSPPIFIRMHAREG